MTKYTKINDIPDNDEIIEEIYIALSIEEKGEDVGVVSFITDAGMMPIVFSKKEMIDKVRKSLKKMSKGIGTKIVIYKFSNKEKIEEFDFRQ